MMFAIAHTVKSLALGAPSLIFGGRTRRATRRGCIAFAEQPGAADLKLESDAFGRLQSIPRQYTADGENHSPPLRWSSVPAGTRSLALIVEDPDARLSKPFVHWLVYNILPDETDLPEGVPPGPILRSYCLLQGVNSAGTIGYVGAAPPRGDEPHQYHFQLFALDRVLPLNPGVNRSTLLRAFTGRVLAKGELVGTYRR